MSLRPNAPEQGMCMMKSAHFLPINLWVHPRLKTTSGWRFFDGMLDSFLVDKKVPTQWKWNYQLLEKKKRETLKKSIRVAKKMFERLTNKKKWGDKKSQDRHSKPQVILNRFLHGFGKKFLNSNWWITIKLEPFDASCLHTQSSSGTTRTAGVWVIIV